MVVIILARELLVTSLRGMSEGSGQAFGAAFSGKLKMVFQSVTILVILVYVNYLAAAQRLRRGARRPDLPRRLHLGDDRDHGLERAAVRPADDGRVPGGNVTSRHHTLAPDS